jgi:SAM-dependent methyltransferase
MTGAGVAGPDRPADDAATLEDVAVAYRWLLGREAESTEVLAHHLALAPTREALRRRFLDSAEFRAGVPPSTRPPVVPLDAAPIEVETEADPARLAWLLAETGRYWSRIGEEAPHWSVLTSDIFRPERIAETEAQFHATGAQDLALIRAMMRRCGLPPRRLIRKVCEFGCGLGRVTSHLARAFPEVVGLDISRAHLAGAARWLDAEGIGNVTLRQVTAENLHPAQGYDLWFSRIVLQHNPPPVMLAILRAAFRGLAPGGVAIFQVPTYAVGYRFLLDEYLGGPIGQNMEMHVLPQPALFGLAAAEGVELLETRDDTAVIVGRPDLWVSNMFCFRRRPDLRPGLGTVSGLG